MREKDSYFGPESNVVPIPAPIGGLDSLSPLAKMPPENASVLENFIPRPGWVELRGGYVSWCQNLASNSPVESLLVYRPEDGSERLFAACSNKIYETTTTGAPTLVVDNLYGNPRWQYINFTPADSSTYMCAVNGNNPWLVFDGTTVTNTTVTGVNTANWISITTFQRRIFAVEVNSTHVWYLGVDAIAGEATLLDVGPVLTQGSFVTAVTTWTVDGGNGPRDLLVIISDRGQIVIYQGTDPTNSNTWAIVGVFDLGRPIGRRCHVKLGSEVGLITLDGLIPLSKALPFATGAQRSVALSAQIQPTISSLTGTYKLNFGWECISYPNQNLLLLNVPLNENGAQIQYVMNQITGKWCKFSGWNANCFAIFNDALYFGDNEGNVNLGYTSSLDKDQPIFADMRHAFNDFGMSGSLKHMSMVRPFFITDAQVTPTIGVDYDFSNNIPTASVVFGTPIGATWDVSLWDQANWNVGNFPVNYWLSSEALGTYLALRLTVNYGGTVTNAVNYGFFDVGTFDNAVFDGTGAIAPGTGIPTLQLTQTVGIVQKGGPI